MSVQSLFYSLMGSLLLLSCSDMSTKGVFEQKNTYNYAGIYSGILPCQDCLGMEATLTLHQDSTFNAVFYHINNDMEYESLKGKIAFIETDIFQLQVTDNQLVYNYKIISDSLLLALDNNFNLIEENNADAYRLSAIESFKPEQIIGQYLSGDSFHVADHILDIQHVEDNEYSVLITYQEGKNGCDFDGFATLINNQLNIRLKRVRGELNSTLVIRFIDDTAKVFTAKKENHLDLQEFCNDGKSLEGYYVKQTDVTSQEPE